LADVVLLAAGLLVLAVLVAGLFRRVPIPDSVALVLVGMLLAELARRWPPAAHLQDLRLSPDLVFFVLLPALVFESGLNLDTRRLLKNLAPVLTLAVPALMLSTAIVGLGLWWLAGMDLLVALLFGALISATDPVAVVALFREVGAPARLGVLVEGESLFNDATAIVVFGLLLALALGGGALDAGTLLAAVPRFVVVFVGGALLGVALGALASEISYRLRSPPPALLAMSVATAYLSFIVAEHGAHVSGVMGAVGASIAFGALGVTRITRDTRQVLGETWELLAFVCNALLFLLVGLAVDVGSLLARWPLILAALVLVHAARAVAVYGLVPLTTRAFALPSVAPAERHIMWWGGLKGGLAVAIALSVPESLPARQLVLDVTVGVVLFTLLVNASTLRPLMRRLGMDRLRGDDLAERDEALMDAREGAERALEQFRGDGIISAGMHHRLVRSLVDALAPAAGAGASTPDAARAAQLTALRAEASALDALYECRAIDQYAYLELRDLLARDQEAGGDPAREAGSVFRRLEAAALRWLRERDWAAGVLSRYQAMRLDQHLQHNLAGVVMAEAALAALAGRDEDLGAGAVQALREQYADRAQRRRGRLASVQREFPRLFERFEGRTFRRAALVAALRGVEREVQHGQLGAKAGAAVRHQLLEALHEDGAQPERAAGPQPRELLGRVPAFRGLSAESLDALAAEARPVTFLPGDVVIGEGERGDALYVISRGRVAVTRRAGAQEPERLAELRDGEIFGEAALLGDPVRNATVTALEPSTLLRMTRGQALRVAERWPEVGDRLRAIDDSRQPDQV